MARVYKDWSSFICFGNCLLIGLAADQSEVDQLWSHIRSGLRFSQLAKLYPSALIYGGYDRCAAIVSFNIGPRQPNRVLETLRFSLLYTLVLGVLIETLGFLLPDQLVTLFSGDQSAQYHQVASQAMSLYFLLFLAAGPNYLYLLAAYLQSTGKPALSIMINCLKGFALVILCLLVLPDRSGLAGVWLSRGTGRNPDVAVSECLHIVLSKKILRRKRSLTRRLVRNDLN